jgi:hypothetical protein
MLRRDYLPGASLLEHKHPPLVSLRAWLAARGALGLSHGALLAAASLLLAVLVGGVAGGLAARGASGGGGAPAPASECEWPEYRLPGSAVPVAYAVAWDLSRAFAPPFPFTGNASVTVAVAAGVSCVLVHARDLTVSAALVGGGGAETPLAAAPDALAFSERLVVRLPAPLAAAAQLTLRFAFNGTLSATNIGFYYSSFSNGSASVPLVQTKFEPAFARTAFPCFDEPALKATFNLSLRGVPAGYTALSNMPPTAHAGDAVAFATSPVMSTYQLMAVVAPMVSVAGTLPPSTPVTCYTMDRGNASLLAGCAFAVSTAVAVLTYYAATFASMYPLPSLSLVYLPVFPVGAMEQWGCVTFTESYLAANSASAAGVVAHELAHSWWGNLVTAEFWEALWLQEGAATFWPNVVLPLVLPALQYETGWRASTSGAMAEDVFVASQSLTAAPPPASSGGAYALFSSVTYDKGAAVYAALRRRTEAARAGSFVGGLRALLAARAYGAITPPALVAALAEASGVAALGDEVGALLYSSGVPLVTAAWQGGSAASGTLRLTLSRFAAPAAGAAAAPWVVPLTVLSQRPSPELAAAASAAAVALAASGGYAAAPLAALALRYNATADGFLLLSNGSAGEYFRVAYPAEALGAFAAALAGGGGGGLAPDARAALLDDTFAVAEARAGCATCDTAAALQWAAAWVRADAAPQVAAAMAARVARLFALLVDDVPLGAGAGVAPAAATRGTPRYACTQALLAYARDALGVAVSGLNASVAALARPAALAALDAAAVDAASASGALTRLAVPGGRDLAWTWAKANWARLTAWYGYRSTLATLTRALGRGFTSPELAADFAAFFAARGAATPVVDGAWQRAVEAARANAAFFSGADAAGVCAFVVAAAPAVRGRGRGRGGDGDGVLAAARGSERASGGEPALV